MKRPEDISKLDWQLLQRKYRKMEPIVKKIKDGYPIQYLIGNVDFYGYIIKVNKNVLIPRFETELLVDKTIKYIKKLHLENSSVLDIGTGSGCISIALNKELPNLIVTAIDNSRKAIRMAKRNVKLNKLKFNVIHKDIFKFNLLNDYDVIISNPPYISYGDNVSDNIKYEPKEAIYVLGSPLLYYEQIFKVAKNSLNKKSLIALEIDELQGDNIKKMAKTFFPKSKIVLEKDLTQKNRYLFVISE